VRDGRLLDTPDRRGDDHMYYSCSSSSRHHDRHHYHPYRRNDKGYLPDIFKKAKPPTFDEYVKKLKDTEAWILGIQIL